jgi:uncharacterized protein YegJ (DUF2314 family)
LRFLPIIIIAIGAIVLCLVVDPPHSITERAETDQTDAVLNDDPAMRQAMEKARSSLDQFLLKVEKPDGDIEGYAVKVGISAGRDVEYFWIKDFVFSGDKFTGKIGNEPQHTGSVQPGQLYSFGRDRIVDWTYTDAKEHRMYGNFTACALLTKESVADADKFKQRFGLDCS